MPILDWSDDLVIDHAAMDETHREFVVLLNRLGDAPDEDTLLALDELIEHTEAHFAQEERWMIESGFPPLHCHTREHGTVLEVARDVRARVSSGELPLARRLADALGQWFAGHAASMDTVLAQFLRQVDYTPTRLAALGADAWSAAGAAVDAA